MPKKDESGANAKAEIEERKQQLLDLTGAFCDARLNADYKRLCKKLIDRMARKRPPPFLRGKPEIWAAGIVHALGSMNFLFDKSFKPYASATDIAAYFGVAPGSAAQKASAIRDMFKLDFFNTEYLTKQMQEKMAPTFDAILQMEQLLSGDLVAMNSEGDTIEQGQFIARDSPAQSRFYALAERYQRSGPTPAIEQSLHKLIEQDPDFYDSYLMLRDILLRTGRDEEAEELLNAAYARALARITDARGHWPPALEWGWLENRHLIRVLLNKALDDWTHGRTDAALDLLRKLLRSNPGDNIGAREYILGIRMGMTFEGFENQFMSQYGYDAIKMLDWFDKNSRRFPEEFDWWKKAVGYES
ncbi:MAG TPA: DUF6398 domain-containing protein [Chthonomonadaceae bacterium]|nr:DUF6398 domain-containing protein [Chthonomonadaceae bacterium]